MVNDSALLMTTMNDFNNVKNTNANNNNNATIPQAVILVYHESAHSIVFRDGLHSQQGAIKQRTAAAASFSSSFQKSSRSASLCLSNNANKKVLTRGYSALDDADSSARWNGNDTDLSSVPNKSSSSRPLLYRHSSMPIGGGSSSSIHTPQTAANTVVLLQEGYESSDSSLSVTSSASGGGSYYCGKGGKVHPKNNTSKAAATTIPTNIIQPLHQQPTIVIANFQPIIEPLEPLQLHSSNTFEPLLHATPEQIILHHLEEQGDDVIDNDEENFNTNSSKGGEMLTEYECEVIEMLKQEKAIVKTIRNCDWTTFIQKFIPVNNSNSNNEEKVKNGDNGNIICTRMAMGKRKPHPAERTEQQHDNSLSQSTPLLHYNSFITSTSLLPSNGKKMRCFGSTSDYTVGVVFALPTTFTQQQQQHDHYLHNDTNNNNINESELEDEAARRTLTWSWPSGYSAKTEYNINENGYLINGRYEALVSISTLRQLNHSYLFDTDYIVGGRLVKGGLTTVPYNEAYVRVGGFGRIVNGIDISNGTRCTRIYDTGLGLPIALFIRDASFGSIVRLLRTRARYFTLLGVDAARDIPLLLITPELGVCVFTRRLQQHVLKVMAQDLNPFQNSALAHTTSLENTSEIHLQQKLEELLDINDDNIKGVLTPEELARIAGGFGATDESVANLLYEAVQRDRTSGGDKEKTINSSSLQDIVNEGLAFSLRANDYHTSRQLLILYTLVSAKCHDEECKSKKVLLDEITDKGYQSGSSMRSSCPSTIRWRDAEKNILKKGGVVKRLLQLEILLEQENSPPPPPPPLDTDRLRSATNSDGLLAVLGAAQVLRAMQEQSAKCRVNECIDALDK